ncbi:MAG TPA: aspartate-alanine antiporter [Chthoniobacterales bacterium]|jgi:putative transport protein|nr:aspartate-alanine antiporter [Chthoniobacterales bacterium]
MRSLYDIVRSTPELAIFLTLAIGFYVGQLKIRGFSLGSVVGVLMTGLIIGQLGIPISPAIKSVFFLFFLFAVGYGVGPQFFHGLKSEGISQALFAALVCLACLVTAFLTARLFRLGIGYGTGVFGGACTVSSVLGVAAETIRELGGSPALHQDEINAMSIAFAITYIFGTAGVSAFLALLGPKILGVDLPAECKALETAMGANDPDPSVHSAYHAIGVRAYRVTDPLFAEITVSEFESRFPDQRVFIERLRQNDKVVDSTPETTIHQNDVVAIASRTETLIADASRFGVEISDPELLDYPSETLDVMITGQEVAGKTLGESVEIGHRQRSRGVFLRALTRGGHELPFNTGTKISNGDILRISGSKRDVERAAAIMGYPIRPSDASNVTLIGLGIFLGAIVGSLSIRVGEIPISLSTSGGTLLAGLIFGWLRSVHPNFGNIPSAGLWVFNNVGLSMFAAVVGIQAGPQFVQGLQEAGVTLLLAGVIVTIVPMFFALLIGKYLFKMHPGILLGACAGARASTAALSVIQDAANSRVPALGFTVCFAVSNTLLTIWGVVIVLLLQ